MFMENLIKGTKQYYVRGDSTAYSIISNIGELLAFAVCSHCIWLVDFMPHDYFYYGLKRRNGVPGDPCKFTQ